MPPRARNNTRMRLKMRALSQRVKEFQDCDSLLSVVDTKWHKKGDFSILETRNVQGDLADRCVELVRINMQESYDRHAGEWTWDTEKKHEEVTHKDTRVFVFFPTATDGDNGDVPCALLSVRAEVDEDCLEARLYIWEIQVHPDYQRQGLGSHLMLLAEELAKHFRLDSVTLTVFKDNEPAQRFYRRKLKYCTDVDDPSVVVPNRAHEFPHNLLTKHM
ncbi:MAG: hypothetical protein MHM6MM_008605 [Cercozoa sp. M6MM]